MDKELLSFVIGMLLTKPSSHMGPVSVIQGRPIVDASLPSLDRDVVRENAEAMRDLIAERLTSNAKVIADALVERIKLNSQMPTCDVMFELCDEVVSSSQLVMTNRVTSINPRLSGALVAMLAACNYPFTPPMMDSSKNALIHSVNQLGGYVTQMKMGIEALTQVILSSETYSPLSILRNSDSKVVIMHDNPDKDKLRAIADEKNMIVLTVPSMRYDQINPIHPHPELTLLLMINAYNSTSVDNDYIFPKDIIRDDSWATSIEYVSVEQYIDITDGIRDELARKAPEFLKDFDRAVATIHNGSDK